MSIIQKVLAMKNGDKILHFVGGAAVGVVASLVGFPQLAIPAAAVVGAAKEGYDYLNQEDHTVDWKDFAATLAGGVVVQLVYFLTWPSA